MQQTDFVAKSDFKIIQDKKTFCYGIDAILLGDFVVKNSFYIQKIIENLKKNDFSNLEKEIKNRAENKISLFDFGCGNAIIPLLICAILKSTLKEKFPILESHFKITGIEIQQKIFQMAQKSIELNEIENLIQLKNCDILEIEKFFEKNSAEVVFSNPPYFKVGKGRISSNEEKMIARQEIKASLKDFVQKADFLLKNEGEFFLIHRIERLPEIIELLRQNNFGKMKIQKVRPFDNEKENLILVKSIKMQNNELKFFDKEMNVLTIYKEKGIYSSEVEKIYQI